ncbi:unnamed protein product [Rotaria sordida]|uniref:Uncharacterized protein n=1 Tax=Rotaria sordida TaxID=392033 RepID=A0A815KSD3_9BILA|nr:unnamed protein product [Rotaria sordida]CAF1399488.1 unnamed protein product [Rotaria sordida]
MMLNRIPHTNIVSPIDKIPTIEGKKRPRRRSIIREFCLNTSTHALPGIARSESIHNRIFWSVSFIGFAVIMIYFIVKAIMAYFDYPTNMDVTYTREWLQYFPAFSFCNGSPLRYDQVMGPFLSYINAINMNGTTTVDTFQISDLWNFLIYKSNRNESIGPFFYSLSSMLRACTYNFQQCSAQDFIPFLSSSYGLCYTFNAKLKNSNSDSRRYTNQNGGDGNLYLSLYVHSHQYIPYGTNSVGIIALVHDNTQLPLIEAAGLELAPGRKHKLGYRKKAAYFLSSPYTSCTSEISPSMKAMLEKYNGADYGYSETICYQLCGQLYTYEQCGCVNPNLWNARSIVKPGDNEIIVAPLCNVTDLCYSIAVTRLSNSSSLMDKYCSDCSQACTITSFIVQASSSRAPLEWEMNDIKAFVENSSVSLPANWSITWREHIHADYLAVSIVRETNIVETNSETAVLGLVDVLSNIGGQTGLWIAEDSPFYENFLLNHHHLHLQHVLDYIENQKHQDEFMQFNHNVPCDIVLVESTGENFEIDWPEEEETWFIHDEL